jgi:hypothetical protein
MPELPEVETIRRQLAPAIEGRRLVHVEVRDPRWSDPAPPEAVSDALDGRRVERLDRRGKYLIASLEDDVHLVMHLRMTGNLLLRDDDEIPPHTRVVFELDDGRRLLFVDVRRFGTGDVLLGSDALADYFESRLGVEPLGPALHQRRAPVLQVGAHGPRGHLADRDHALLRAFAENAQEAVFQIDLLQRESAQLRHAQSARIKKFEDRSVAQRDRVASGRSREQFVHVFDRKRPRNASR